MKTLWPFPIFVSFCGINLPLPNLNFMSIKLLYLLPLLVLTSCSQLSSTSPATTKKMDSEQLLQILQQHAEEVSGEAGHWQMIYDGQHVICMTDEANDRMRFISPVIKTKDLTPEQAVICMTANFSRALDTRYCIYGGELWAAFIHPLSELSPEFALSGLQQTATLVKNFGTTYASSELGFQ